MNKIITISIFVATLLATQSSFAVTSTGNAKATATLASSCQISTTNVNFGQLNLQAAQSGVTATSSMNLYCTKGSAYTISLAYGGVYGSGGGSGIAYGTLYNAGNQYDCSYSYTVAGKQYNYDSGNGQSQSCPAYNYSVPGYSYGIMTGSTKGDTISYKITVPGDDTKVWNTGNSTYANTGSGAVQNFPIKATIQTGTHGSLYPAADTYMDTVTATVSY